MVQALQHLEQISEKYAPGYPFEYAFLDDAVVGMYRSEQRMGDIITLFAVLAICISCLGLFGLSSFMAERRTREIGIRKVLGASVPGLVLLLSREFAGWGILANIIAWPMAYAAMDSWLQDFAYRIDIGLGSFFLSACLALGIAVCTVSAQTIKTALSNPVDSLRYE